MGSTSFDSGNFSYITDLDVFVVTFFLGILFAHADIVSQN